MRRDTTRRHRALAAALTIALLAGACGSSDDGEGSSPTTSASVATDTSTTDPATTDPATPATTAATSAAPPSTNPAGDDVVADAQELSVDGVSVVVPPGSPRVTAESATIDLPDGFELVAGIEFGPDGATFEQPVTATVSLPDHGPGDTDAYTAVLVSADGTAESAAVTLTSDEMTVEIPHFSMLYITVFESEQTSPLGPVSVGDTFEFDFEPGGSLAPAVWGEIDTPEGLDVLELASATMVCLAHGEYEVYLWGLQELADELAVFFGAPSLIAHIHAHGYAECVETDEADLIAAATLIEWVENHPGGDVADVDFVAGLSAMMALLDIALDPSTVPDIGVIVDGSCDGLTEDDTVPFVPATVDDAGALPVVIEQYGCFVPFFAERGSFTGDPGTRVDLTITSVDEAGYPTLSNGVAVMPMMNENGEFLQLTIDGSEGPMDKVFVPWSG